MHLANPKRWLPLLVALVAGSIAIVSFILPNPISDGIFQIVQMLTAAGLLIGIMNVLNVHRKRIAARAHDWRYSIVLIVALLTTFVLGVLPTTFSNSAFLGILVGDIFRYIYQPLAGSLLALLTFFALRAAWRALQIRPGEASIILGVAIFFLVAGGPWAAAVPGLNEILDWIRDYPVLGVARGLLLGVGIGALVASARLLLGFDQPYLDR